MGLKYFFTIMNEKVIFSDVRNGISGGGTGASVLGESCDACWGRARTDPHLTTKV